MLGMRKVSDAALEGKRTWGRNVRLLRDIARTGETRQGRAKTAKAARRQAVSLRVTLVRLRRRGECLGLMVAQEGCAIIIGPDRSGKGGAR